jgi:hypothetical protein
MHETAYTMGSPFQSQYYFHVRSYELATHYLILLQYRRMD